MKAMYDKTLQEMQGFENLWHTGERDLASNKWEQWVQTSQSDQPDADIATLITNNIGSQILGERARQGSLVGIITSQEVPEEIDMSRIHPPKDLWDCHEQRARAHWERIIQKDYGGVFEGLQGEDALNRFYSRVESHTQSLIENAKVFRRVRTMALYEVLKNGDKKLPTTGPSTIRNHLKNQAMYGSSEAPTDAYMSDSDSGVLPPKETEDYGAITVRLKKDRVMKRATLAFDDTGSHYWHAENELTVIPRPADRLGIEVWPLTRMRNFWGILNEVELSQDQNPLAVRRISDLENYVEVEVHKKGLEIGDIEKVYLPSPDHQEEEEKAALSEITKQLDECNIEWEYLNA